MAKEEKITLEGEVTEALPDARFKVKLENDQTIHVSKVDTLNHSLLATGFPYVNDDAYDLNMEMWSTIYGKTQGIRRAGSAAIDLAYVAAGRLDGFWELALNPWDQAAGALLVTEAGGVVSRIDGKAFKPEYSQMLAGTPKVHAALLQELQPFVDRIPQ